jgi:hypothetical protein
LTSVLPLFASPTGGTDDCRFQPDGSTELPTKTRKRLKFLVQQKICLVLHTLDAEFRACHSKHDQAKRSYQKGIVESALHPIRLCSE